MSAKAMAFALDYDIRPATLKLLLVIMADCANPETRLCFPSAASLLKKTGMNRKTLPGAIDKLVALGLLEELEQRTGRTNQIKVYLFTFGEIPTGPKSDPLETSPILPETGPESDKEQARNRGTEPSRENLEEEQKPPLPAEESPVAGDLFVGLPIDDLPEPLEEYVLRGWAKLHEEFPRIHDVITLGDARRKKIAARAAEVVRGTRGALTPYQVWDQIFAAIRGSRFLRGEEPPSAKYPKPFGLWLDYILGPTVFLQTLERAVNDGHDERATSDPATGRRYGPAEQALREALSRGFPGVKRRRGT